MSAEFTIRNDELLQNENSETACAHAKLQSLLHLRDLRILKLFPISPGVLPTGICRVRLLAGAPQLGLVSASGGGCGGETPSAADAQRTGVLSTFLCQDAAWCEFEQDMLFTLD